MAASREKALHFFRLKRYKEAEEELRKFLAKKSDDYAAHAYLALTLSHLKRMKEAFQESNQAISLAPDDAYPYFVKAILFGRSAKADEALKNINEAIRLNPTDADYHEYLSQIYFAKREWKKALAAADKGLSLDPDHVTCRNARTQALVKLNRLDEAGESLDQNLTDDPEKAATHSQMGFLLLEKGKYEEAEKAFLESMRLNPHDLETREGLARALKTRYPLYSWFLKYFLWLEKLGPQARTFFTVGIYVLFRGASTLAKTDPHLVPWFAPLMVGYIFFVAGTWLSEHLFNMVLCLTPAGRMVLGDDKVLKYLWFGGCLVFTFFLLIAAYFTQEVGLVFGGILNLFLVIPLASVFQIPEGKFRNWMWAYTVFIAACGAIAISIYMFLQPTPQSDLSDINFLFIFCFAAGILLSRIPGKYLSRKALEE